MEKTYWYADLNNDKKVMDKITIMEKELSEMTGKKIVLVVYAD